MGQEIEKIGDEIYKCLGVVQNELSTRIENKAYITEALSEALYEAGYRLLEQTDKREAVAKWLAMRFVYGRDANFNPQNWYGLSKSDKEDVLKDADQILSLFPQENCLDIN